MSRRIKEHKAACRLGNFERSAVTELAGQDGHSIEILDTATCFISRYTKETLHIKLQTTPTCRMNAAAYRGQVTSSASNHVQRQ